MSLVKSSIRIVNDNSYRPPSHEGKPGGLILLDEDIIPIIVGDLHSEIMHLIAILRHDNNINKIRKGTHCLILLGDTVHNDQVGMMKEMEGSLVSLEYIFHILNSLGSSCIYLRGNHDTFDEQLIKSGIWQGREFRDFIINRRSEAYADAIEAFFDSLPLFVIGNKFVTTHGGPIRGGADKEMLINIHDDKDKEFQLLWNRINEYGGTPTRKEYDQNDILATLEKLNLPPDTDFIVGHNPIWGDGNKTGVWMNVLQIPHHHILYSGAKTLAPYITYESGKLIVKYAMEPEGEVRFGNYKA